MNPDTPSNQPAVPLTPLGDSPYFVTGGAMGPKAASYVEREADHELYEAMMRGEFCYVLTSRQMGKTSLFSRVGYRLRQEGFRVCFIDLSRIGTNVSVAQWFDGMLERLGADFGIEDEIDEFRDRSEHLGPNQLWLEVLCRVLLPLIAGRITIIVDEIDLVRSLAFSADEFFIGIRELYNRRSQDEDLNRLSFCLLGVASPADLIANKEVTPFNIGRRIEVRDFTEEEALKLADGFHDVPRPQGEELVRRVYYWTRGQPYLTQKLCDAVVADAAARDAKAVDDITDDLFLNQRARETEPNLTFIRDRILSERRAGRDLHGFETLLRLYRRVRKGKRTEDSEVVPEVTRLKLSGLVCGREGVLEVKNPIYEANFDDRWVRTQLPRNWARIAARAAMAAAAMLLLACLPLAIVANMQRMKAEQKREQLALKTEEAMQQSAEAIRQTQLATEERGRAQAEAHAADLARSAAEKERERALAAENAARVAEKAARDAWARLYRKEITAQWQNGRRFVAGSFLEWHATDGAGDIGLTPAQLALPDIAKELKIKDRTTPADESTVDPTRWAPGPERTSWMEPAGTFGLAEGGPVERLIPWPHGSMMLMLRKESIYDDLPSLFVWDFKAAKAEDPSTFPALPIEFGHLDDKSSSQSNFAITRAFCLARDESRLLLVDFSGKCHLWSLGAEPRLLKHELPSDVRAAALGGNSLIVASTDGSLQVYPDPVSAEMRLLRGPDAGDVFTCLAVSPDEMRFLTGERDGTVREWDLQAGTATGRTWKLADRLKVLAYHPEGTRFLVATAAGAVELHDTPTGTKLAAFTVQGGVESAMWSPDGTKLAIGGMEGGASLRDGNQPGTIVRTLPIAEAVLLRSWKGQTRPGNMMPRYQQRIEVRFSPDGNYLYTANQWDRFRVWESKTGSLAFESKAQEREIRLAYAVGPQTSRYYSPGIVSSQGDLLIAEPLEKGGKRLTAPPKKGETDYAPWRNFGEVRAVAVCGPRAVVAAATYTDVLILRPSDVSSFEALEAGAGEAIVQRIDKLTLAKIPGGVPSTPAGSKSKGSPADGRKAESEDNGRNIVSLAFSGDGRYLAIGFSSGEVALLESDLPGGDKPFYRGRWRKSLMAHTPVSALGFLDSGEALIAASSDSGSAFEIRDGKKREYSDFKPPFEAAPDGLSRVSSVDGKNWQWGGTLVGSGSPPTAFAWSPDGAWCAAGLEDGSISLGNLGKDEAGNRRFQLVETIPAFAQRVTALGFLPDGSGILATDASRIVRWWTLSRKAPKPLIAPGGSAKDARDRWQVGVEDFTKLVTHPQPAGKWLEIPCDPEMTAAILQSRQIISQADSWFYRSPNAPAMEEVRRCVGEVPAIYEKLQTAGCATSHLTDAKSFAELLGRSEPPDAAALRAIRALPLDFRWLLLQGKVSEWAPALDKREAAGLWFAYAECIDLRVSNAWGNRVGKVFSDISDSSPIDLKSLPAGWQKQIDLGVDAVKKAFIQGRAPDRFTSSNLPFLLRLAALKSMATSARAQADLAKKCYDAFGEASTSQSRRQALREFDEAISKGAPLSFGVVFRAGIACRRLGDYDRAEREFSVAETLADTPYNRAELLVWRGWLARDMGKPSWEEAAQMASEFGKKATDEAPTWSFAWSERAQLERLKADGKPNRDGILAALSDYDRAIEFVESDSEKPELMAAKVGLCAQLEDSVTTRRMAEECLKEFPAPNTYLLLWNKWEFSTEADRDWAWVKLDEGIKLAVDTNDEKALARLRLAHAKSRNRRNIELREAVRELTAAFRFDGWTESERAELLRELSYTFRLMGLFEECKPALERVRKFNGEEMLVENEAGHVFLAQGSPREAAAAFKKSLETSGLTISYFNNGSNLVKTIHAEGDSLRALSESSEFLKKAPESKWAGIMLDQARIYADLASDRKLSSADRLRWQEKLTSTLNDLVPLLRPVGGKINSDLVTVALLRHDDTLVRTELARDKANWPTETNVDRLSKATLHVIEAEKAPEQRERALAELAQVVATGWYYVFFVDYFAEYRPLRELPEWRELRDAMKIGKLAELPERELRLATWIEKIDAKSPEVKDILAKAAQACRKRAEEDRAHPLVVDWKSLEPKEPKQPEVQKR